MGRRVRRRGRRGRSKLADKRINTLFEKRAKEIADKAVRDGQVWYNGVDKIANFQIPGAWSTHGPYVRVPDASCLTVNAGTMWHKKMSSFGQMLKNDINSTDDEKLLVNYVRCKSMQASFDFRHSAPHSVILKLFIVAIPSAYELETQGATVPDARMTPGGGTNLLFRYRQRLQREFVQYKYRVVASKTVRLPAADIYTPAYPINNNNNTVWNLPAHKTVQRTVSIAKYFKGAGKQFQMDNDTDRAVKEEYYLCFTADTAVSFCAVTHCKFRLEEAQTRVPLILVDGQ